MKKYKIYHRNSSNEKVIDLIFEVESNEKAIEQYNKFIAEHVDDGNTYFYDSYMNYGYKQQDGTIKYFDSMDKMFSYRNQVKNLKNLIDRYIDDIVFWFDIHIIEKIRKFKYSVKDFIFWFKNYNAFHCTSHMRSESWSLDNHLLSDLAFNIPLIQQTDSVPGIYYDKAREDLKEKNPEYVVLEEMLNNFSYTDEEMELAKKLWSNELDNGLRKIGLYMFFANCGELSENEMIKFKLDDKPKSEYDKLIEKSFGTEHIDYKKLEENLTKSWNDIWDWFKEYGRMLWT